MRYCVKPFKINLLKIKLFLSVFIVFSFVFIGYQQWFDHRNNDTVIYEPVVVLSGDTLWELAEKSTLNNDIRNTIIEIMNYNYLQNSTLHPGQVIYIPMRTSQIADSR